MVDATGLVLLELKDEEHGLVRFITWGNGVFAFAGEDEAAVPRRFWSPEMQEAVTALSKDEVYRGSP